MSKLQKIYDEIQQVKNRDVSDFQKMKSIYALQKQAGAETWSTDEKYRLSANSLHDYAQTQWSDIYIETDKETQQNFKELMNKEFLKEEEWPIV